MSRRPLFWLVVCLIDFATVSRPFLALLLGILAGGAANILNQRFYHTRFVANECKAVPEARLPPM